jgi:hypothetical protein
MATLGRRKPSCGRLSLTGRGVYAPESPSLPFRIGRPKWAAFAGTAQKSLYAILFTCLESRVP